MLLVAAVLVPVFLTFRYLSSVLVPFLVAGVVAYLLNPVCNFLQHKCRLRVRMVCVVLTMVAAIALVAGLLWLCVPPMFEECAQLRHVALRYFEQGTENTSIPMAVREFFESRLLSADTYRHIASGDVQSILESAVPQVWGLFRSTVSVALSVVSSLIGLLYLFFLLMDYEHYAKVWTGLIPVKCRGFARQFVTDVTFYMCGYFRGQLVIALSNCVMFTVGFLLIGFPMPIALGCFIGIISFVPYLQVVGFLPAALLALLRAAETGENFWVLTGGVLLVYVVVQVIQDVLVTPKVMGRIMGLTPAIVLLALSLGAYIGGIGGLIVALPVTTLALTYYKRYVLKEDMPAAS